MKLPNWLKKLKKNTTKLSIAGYGLMSCSIIFSSAGYLPLINPLSNFGIKGILIFSIISLELAKTAMTSWIVEGWSKQPILSKFIAINIGILMLASAAGSYQWMMDHSTKEKTKSEHAQLDFNTQQKLLENYQNSLRFAEKKIILPPTALNCEERLPTLRTRCYNLEISQRNAYQQLINQWEQEKKTLMEKINELIVSQNQSSRIIANSPDWQFVMWRSIGFAALLELGALFCWLLVPSQKIPEKPDDDDDITYLRI